MKKMFALLMTLALVISVLAVPALAEESTGTVDQVASATTNNNSQDGQTAHGGRQQMPGRGGRNGQVPGQNSQNGQMPQMPGQNDQNSQMPQMPGQNNQSGQMPNQNSQNGQMPGMGGRNGRQGNGMNGRNGKAGKQDMFAQMLADGVITQEVYDAITAWMNQRMQQAPQDASASADTANAPALPDSTEGAGAREDLLKELLDSGVITQEQYDVLNGGFPAAPAAN